MEHLFRLILLYAVYIVPIHFMDIEDKFIIQIGGVLGITLAYIIAILILKRRKKKEDH